MSIISTQMSSSIKNGSWIRRMFEAGIQLKQKYGDDAVCDFSLGNPDLAPPPAVGKALVEFVKHVDEPFSLGYMPNNGFGWAREKLAAHLSKEQGVELTANDVILTCGAAGALNVIFRTVLEPGDEVLTVTPYFVEYGSYVGNHGGTLKKVPTLPGTFGLDLPAIEAAITPKTRAMIINSPHNPTGTVYSRKELEGLTAILAKASERNGRPLYLVVDEPYRFLAFDGVEVPSLLPMYPYAVLASSFSKNLCLAGERVGFIALSPLFAERAELMGGLTLANRILGFVNPPVVGQHIMAGALGSQVDVNIYARRREMMGNVLSDAGYEFQMPKGAFYFFPKAPGGDDVAFVNKLLDERILAVPGSGFGGPATSAWRSASRTRSSPAPPKGSSGPAGREAFSGGKAAARFPQNPEKCPSGTASSWVPDGRIPACRRNHFPGLAISVPFNHIPPNASGLAAAFPRFSSPFKKIRGLPCVLRDISRDWKPHQNLWTGTFSRGAASFAFPIMNALIVLTQADQPCKESRSRGYHG